jgi:predicted nuclease with TOPRIM domain
MSINITDVLSEANKLRALIKYENIKEELEEIKNSLDNIKKDKEEIETKEYLSKDSVVHEKCDKLDYLSYQLSLLAAKDAGAEVYDQLSEEIIKLDNIKKAIVDKYSKEAEEIIAKSK